MASKFERTSTPGIYKRGNSYIVRQRDRMGRTHSRSAPTMAAAKNVKAELRGEYARGALRVQNRDSFESCASRPMTDTITSDAGQHHEACRTALRGMSDSGTSDDGHFRA